VCACFGVGLNTIVNAIESQQLTSVEQIGMALKAGTNCGSCQPELRQILLHKQQPVSSPQEIVNGA
jgi:assimilatory nitrate reductase catalytic subunit